MGGGASVLSSEDFVTMSQNLKEEYEVLITSGYTDDEMRIKLMEKYNELFVTSEPSVLKAASSGGETDFSAILVGAGTSKEYTGEINLNIMSNYRCQLTLLRIAISK